VKITANESKIKWSKKPFKINQKHPRGIGSDKKLRASS
jgi:hypothetical protein